MADALTQKEIVSTAISVLVTSLFIFFAARFVLDRSSFVAAILTAVLGSVAAAAVFLLVEGGVLGFALAIAVWALLAALFFRTDWIKGAIIGLVAWVLWLVVTLVIRALL